MAIPDSSRNPYAASSVIAPESTPAITDQPRASTVRYRVLALFVLMAVLLYLDRFVIGAATPAMIAEIGITADEPGVTKEQFGRAVGAFFLAYALCQVPMGRLSDRFGSRATLATYVVGWSLVTMAIGFAQTLGAILALRAMLGVAQAGAYPAAAAAIKRWFPLAERARANGSVSGAGRLGGLLAFAVTPLVMGAIAWSLGWTSSLWRPVFVLYGSLGLVWAAAYWIWFRDEPAKHPACNPAELAVIADGVTAASADGQDHPVGAGDLLLSLNTWALCAINLLLNCGWIFLTTWLLTYLTKLQGNSDGAVAESSTMLPGLLTAATGFAGILGNLSGGWWGDRLTRRLGKRWGRRIPGTCSMLVAAGLYLAAVPVQNVWLVAALMAGIYFMADVSIGSLWAVYQDIGGRSTATVLGFANMCGNLGAAGCSWLIGYLADGERWDLVFYASASAFTLAAICWLFVDASRPLTASKA